MEKDESLALDLLRGGGESVLRLYTWSPWSVSLGRHQVEGEIDRERCLADGIEIVRRPTGGRAILHAEELTYCVAMMANGQSVLQVYNAIGVALLRGLRAYGVHVSLEKSQPNFGTLYRQTSSASCFSSSARYEIVLDKRKLVGSAQRRYGSGEGTVVLQHGSILCGSAHLRLAEYLRLPDEGTRQAIRENLKSRTANLGDVMGNRVDFDLLSRCVKEGFEREWGITFQEHSLVMEHGAVNA